MTNEETTPGSLTPETGGAAPGEPSPVPGESAVLTENPVAGEGSVDTEPSVTRELPAPPEPSAVPTPPPPARPTVTPAPTRRSPWLLGLMALLLVVASSGVTYLLATAEQETPSTEEVVGDPGAIEPGEEPIADAAAVILPSVVQIQTGTGPGSGLGSGVIYDPDGLVLTAAHVVRGNETVTVRFADGEQVQGTVLGGTEGADVAVVQVDRTGLPAADLALDDDPVVGQLAIAV